MPKPLTQHQAALSEAIEHLKKLAHVDVELSACQQAIHEDVLKTEQLRSQRAAITDVDAMKKISSEQRIVEASESDNRDRLDALQNRRKELRAVVPDLNQRFVVAYGALTAQLTAEFRQRYTKFLEEQLRPLIELGNALSCLGEIGFILSGINVNRADQKSAFVTSGVLHTVSPKLNPEAIAAQGAIQPWSTAASQLSAIENQLQRENYKELRAARAVKTAARPQFTNADQGGMMPPVAKPPVLNIEMVGKGEAHMYPGLAERNR